MIDLNTDTGRAMADVMVGLQAQIIAFSQDYQLVMLFILGAIPLAIMIGSTKAALRTPVGGAGTCGDGVGCKCAMHQFVIRRLDRRIHQSSWDVFQKGWMAGSSPAMTAGVHSSARSHVEKHRLVVALQADVEMIDRVARARLARRDQRGAAIGRHQRQHRIGGIGRPRRRNRSACRDAAACRARRPRAGYAAPAACRRDRARCPA